METKTETVLGKDGVIEYESYYNPRTFVVPVYFESLNNLRGIASWLNSRKATDFYFSADKLKIKVKIDGAVDISRYLQSGLTELKFIAYDPYYYAVNDIKYTFQKFDRGNTQINPLTTYNAFNLTLYDRYTPIYYEATYVNYEDLINSDIELYWDGIVTKNGSNITVQIDNFSSFNMFNDGNVESYPLIKLTGSGNITVGVNGKTFTVNNVNSYVYIDSLYMTCYKDTTNYISNFSGEFIKLSPGINTFSITGNITSVEIQCRSRWL